MTTTINADNGVVSTIPGLKYSADSSGILVLQTNTTNALTLDASQNATFATGILATNPFAGSFSDGTVVDYTTGVGRITVGTSDDIAFYHNGIASRTEIARFTYGGNMGLGTNSPVVSGGYTSLTINNATNSGYVVLQTNGVTTSDWYVSGGLVATIRGVAVPLTFSSTGANYIAASTNGTERMRIDSSGNVGIGTASPTTSLAIVDNATAANTKITISRTALGTTATYSSTELGTTTASPMDIITNGSTRMRVDASGNVGIGTTSPATKAEIYGTAAASNLALRITNTATDGYSTLQLGDANAGVYRNGSAQSGYAGASSLNLITVGAHNIGFSTQNTLRAVIDSSGNVGIGVTSVTGAKLDVNGGIVVGGALTVNQTDRAFIEYASNVANFGAYGATAGTGAVRFSTGGGGGSGGTERMRIDSSGSVGIGTSSPTSYGGSSTKFVVTGSGRADAWFVGGTGQGGYAYFSNNAQATYANIFQIGQGWGTGSDNIAFLSVNSTNPLLFATNGTERFRVGPAGQWGIGGANYGTSGQVMVSGGSGAAPSWGSAVSAGQIIQVLQAINNSTYTVGAATNTALTGMSVTITPRNSSSRFWITFTASIGYSGGATYALNIFRDSTSLNQTSAGTYNGMQGGIINGGSFPAGGISYVDSPATASAITYTIRISNDGTASIGRRPGDTFSAVSQIMQVLEIAG